MLLNCWNYAKDRSYSIVDDMACPDWERAETCNAEDETAHSETLVPSGIGEFLEVRVLHLLEEDEADGTEDIHSCHNDGSDGDDGAATVECVGILKRTVEDCHLGDETGEARQTEVGKTCNNVAYGEERHYLHQAAKLAYVTGVGTAVNHTDEGEEEGCHKSVREHLKNGTGARHTGHHKKSEQHQTAVRHRRVGIDELQVGLHTSGESSIYDRDCGKDKEYPCQIMGSLRQEEHGDAEATVTTKFHKHTGMEH